MTSRLRQVSFGSGILGATVKIICLIHRRCCRGAALRLTSGTLLLQRKAERVIALAQLRVEFECLLERRNGAVEIARLAQRLPELVLDAGIGGIGGPDAPEVFQRALEVTCLAQGDAE